MYDVRTTITKGLKASGIVAGAQALGLGLYAAALAYLGDPAAVTHALSGRVSPLILALLVSAITGTAHAAENWRKNH